jgi:hypothetical protein
MRMDLHLIGVLVAVLAGTSFAQVRSTGAKTENGVVPVAQKHQPDQHASFDTVTVTGYVYWDNNPVQHTPSSGCAGLAVMVSVGATEGNTPTFEQFKPLGFSTNLRRKICLRRVSFAVIPT